ncbi:MAG: hypothetical protein HOV81_38515 [Kofleriaceae bacterium]|nr:hypothetical protein [Kofleriaceae bacterium]
MTALVVLPAVINAACGGGESVGSRQQAQTQAPPPSVPLDPPVGLTPVSVGTLPGSLEVSGGGTATYQVPIDVPAGVRGMQPSVSLSYSSGGGNGVVGVGWSLSPRSSIDRCPKTYANDGQRAGVTLTTADSFCLDGVLMWTNASNGQAGADYRLRIGKTTKITGVGSTDSAASGFEVRQGDGSVRYYGAILNRAGEIRASATILAQSGRPVAWLLKEERDAFGNRIVYEYAENSAKLKRIAYGDHANIAREVEFSYDPRQFDDIKGYYNQAYLEETELLKQITTKVSGEVASIYQLRYDYGDVSHHHLLAGITRCTQGEVCLPETTFEYQQGTDGFVAANPPSHPFGSKPLVANPPKVWTDYHEAGVVLDGEESSTPSAFHVLDANGDGKADVVAQSSAKLDVTHLNVDGDPVTKLNRPYKWYGWGYQAFPSDINESVGPLSMRVESGAGEVPKTDGMVVTALSSFVGRFNADALDDLVEPISSDLYFLFPDEKFGLAKGFRVLASTKGPDPVNPALNSTAEVYELPDADAHPVVSAVPVDANGDGLTDIMFCKADGTPEWDDYTRTRRMPGHWHVLLNTKNGFGVSAAAGGQSLGRICDADDLLLLIDYDGDGRVDPLVVPVRDGQGDLIPSFQWSNYQAFRFTNLPNGVSVSLEDSGLPPDKSQRFIRSAHRAPLHWFNAEDGVLRSERTAGQPWWHDSNGAPVYVGGLSDDKILDVNGDGNKDIVRFELVHFVQVGNHMEPDSAITEADPRADRDILERLFRLSDTPNDWFGDVEYPQYFSDESIGVPHISVWFNTGHGFSRGVEPSYRYVDLNPTYGGANAGGFADVQKFFELWHLAVPIDYDMDGIDEMILPYMSGYLFIGDWAQAHDRCVFIDDGYALPDCGVGTHPWDPEAGTHVMPSDTVLLRFADQRTPCDAGPTCRVGAYFFKDYLKDDPQAPKGPKFYKINTRQMPVGDFDGDGVADIATMQEGALSIWKRNTKPTNLMVRATNGFGHKTEVQYVAGADATWYKAPFGLASSISEPQFPEIRIRTTAPLVKQRREDAEASLGVDHQLITEYQYGDMRADLFGRMGSHFNVTLVDQWGYEDYGIRRRRNVQVGGNVEWDGEVRDYQQTYPSQSFSAVVYDVNAPLALPTSQALSVSYSERKRAILKHGGIWYTPYTSLTEQKVYELPLSSGDPCALNSFDPCGPKRVAGETPVRSAKVTVDSLDDVGFPIQTTTVTGDRTTVTRRTWEHRNEPWLVGLLRRTVATETFWGETLTRSSAMTYNEQGALETVTREPERPEYKQEVSLAYTPNGNPHLTTVTAGDGGTRWHYTYWDDDNVFPIRVENALGHVSEQIWDRRLGVVTETKGENGLSQKTAYDDFGRPRWMRAFRYGQPLGAGQTVDFEKPGLDASPKARLHVRVLDESTGIGTSDYDALGRVLYKKAPGQNGKESYVTFAYDGTGMRQRGSLPAFDGELSPGWVELRRDQRGQLIEQVNADGTTREYKYGSYAQPFTSWWSDEKHNWHRSVMNQYGQVERTLDGYDSNVNGGPTDDDAELCFLYRVGGRLHSTVPCKGILNRTWTGPKAKVVEYDLVGRPVLQQDPQMGTSLLSYTGFDELKTVTSAGQTVLNEYDILGRQKYRKIYKCPDGEEGACVATGTSLGTAVWDYDV